MKNNSSGNDSGRVDSRRNEDIQSGCKVVSIKGGLLSPEHAAGCSLFGGRNSYWRSSFQLNLPVLNHSALISAMAKSVRH